MTANTLLWGAPLTSSYERSAVLVGGALVVSPHSSLFDAPVGAGLGGILFHLQGGLLFAAPAALVALLGYALPAARRAECWGASAASALALLLLAPYRFVLQMPETLPRFALPFVCASVAPLSALFAAGAARLSARRATRPRTGPLP
jgi:hypothetical protein